MTTLTGLTPPKPTCRRPHKRGAWLLGMAVMALGLGGPLPALPQTAAELAQPQGDRSAREWSWSALVSDLSQTALATVSGAATGAASGAAQVGWYPIRAASEIVNVLGFTSLSPAEPITDTRPPSRTDRAIARGMAVDKAPDMAGPVVPGATSSTPPNAALRASLVTPSAIIDEAALNRRMPPGTEPELLPATVLGEGFVNDTPHKLPDGTLVVPKAAQRLFRLRTATAGVTDTSVTMRMDGVVTHQPGHTGHAEASSLGRLEQLDAGIPHLGMRVERGQLLAWLRPTITPLERANTRSDIARLTGEIILAEKRIERLGDFFFVPFREGKIIYERLNLESLYRQRAALLAVLTEREPVRAPIDGVISAIKLSVGQIAETRQTVFEIVDPDSLWVEALAYQHAPPNEIVGASALTADGVAIPLTFVGRGLELRRHAMPYHFRVTERVPNLMAGRPVSVIVRTTAVIAGATLPSESVVRSANGTDIVWEKTGPESFVARPVSTRPLDATRTYIVDGLAPNATVVTSSARMLSQFR